MSEENGEAALRAIKAFNADDLDGFMGECAPEIEFHSRFMDMGVSTVVTSGSDAGTRICSTPGSTSGSKWNG